MIYVYAVKCQNEKWYIGKTTNPKFRLEQHFDSQGSCWTRKYKPQKLDKLIPNCDKFDEDKLTKQYMEKYGIENVRGGSYSSIALDDEQHRLLSKELDSANDNCFRCGETGHFAAQCRFKTEHKEEFVWCCQYCNKEFETKRATIMHENIHCEFKNKFRKGTCYRCGRKGHFSPNCFARTDVYGDGFSESEADSEAESFAESTDDSLYDE